MGYVLVSARGHKQGLKIPVRPKVFLIGSSSRARVRSRKPGVGRQHCVLLRRKKKLYLQDLDCGHPTQINGNAMTPGMRVRLSPGDRVALGPMEFVIGYERDPARAPVLLGAPYTPARRPAPLVPRPVVSGEIAEPLPEPPADPLRGVVVLVVVALICVAGGWLLYKPLFRPSGKDPVEQSQVAKKEEESSERTTQPVLPADLKKPTETASAKIAEQRADTNSAPVRPPEKPPVSKPEEKPAPKPPERPPEKPPEKPAEKPKENPKPQLVYADHVLPVLRTKCLNCHGGDDPKGGLDMTSLAALQKGGNNGEAVSPGSLDKGTLWDNIQSNNMPPGRRTKLTDAEKKIIRDWILSAKDGKLARR